MANNEQDKRIIELFFARDEQAIKQFADSYRGLCFDIAEEITGSPEDAEECLNDTYLRLWNSIPPLRPQSLKSYASRIIRNIALDVTKKKRTAKRSAVLCELDECAVGIPDMDEGEITRAINRFLEAQKPLDAKLFVRRFFYAEQVSAIAARFGISENSVSKRLAKLRRSLAKYLEKEDIGI